MSGGSFNYLYFKSIDELVSARDDVERMAKALEVQGCTVAARDTRNLIATIDEFNAITAMSSIKPAGDKYAAEKDPSEV